MGHEGLERNKAPSVCYIEFGTNIMNTDSYQTSYYLLHHHGIKEALEIVNNAKKMKRYDTAAKEDETFKAYYESIDLKKSIECLAYFPGEYLPYLYNSNFYQRRNENLYWIDFQKLHRGVWTARSAHVDHSHDGETVSMEKYEVQPMMDLYFSMIVELCRENDVTLRVIDPCYPDYVTLTDNYKREYLEYYQKYLDVYENMTVAGIFENFPSSYYGDGSHMNLHGAYKFSSMLREIYPDDFVSEREISDETIRGFSDYLVRDNDCDFISAWIEGKDFSLIVLLYDGKREQELAGEKDQALIKSKMVSSFYLNGISKKVEKYEIEGKFTGVEDTGITNIKNMESVVLALPWGEKFEVERGFYDEMVPDMQIIILNEYDNSIVDIKNYVYNNGEYKFMD